MEPIQLHIGGKEEHPEWKILDIEERDEVDYIGNANQLENFKDNSVARIYASHVLEHFHYGLNNEVVETLKEWKRVLIPGGELYISVPNLKTLCWLYIHPNLLAGERHHIMRMMFGGQVDQYDIHRVGFDEGTLALYLEEAGFVHYESVSEFNLFKDCSSLRIIDTLISLNCIAKKEE